MKKLVYILIMVIVLLTTALGCAVWQIKNMEREQREREYQRKIEFTDSIISHYAVDDISCVLGKDMDTGIAYDCVDQYGDHWTVFGNKDTLYYNYVSGNISELNWVVANTQKCQ